MTVLAPERLPIRRHDTLDNALDLSLPMPQAIDAERVVLASIIINNNAFYRVMGVIINTEDFHKDAHVFIARVMVAMVEEGIEIQPLTLREELAKRNLLEAAGGLAYISGLLDVVPDVARVERYAGYIARAAKRRRNIIAANDCIRASMDETNEPEETAAKLIQSVGMQATREDQQARPLVEVLSETYEYMQRLRTENKSIALTSGWTDLDAHKFFSPTFALTAAPTKSGKSSLMKDWAEGLAANGHPCVIFSLESTGRELSLRYTSARTGIPHGYLRDWRVLSAANFERIAECQRVAAQRRIFISRGPWHAEDIVNEIIRLRATVGIQAAFIDYVQLVGTRQRISSREERLSEVGQLFLQTAVERGIHIHCFSQINDDAEQAAADGKRLRLRDVAYAKQLGKSARIVGLFTRVGKDVNFQIEANNEERTDDIPCHFDEVTQRWGECDHDKVMKCTPECWIQSRTGKPQSKLFAAGGQNGKAETDRV